MHCRREPAPQLGWHYDIREIDEALYVAVLASCRAETADAATDPGDAPSHAPVTARDAAGQ